MSDCDDIEEQLDFGDFDPDNDTDENEDDYEDFDNLRGSSGNWDNFNVELRVSNSAIFQQYICMTPDEILAQQKQALQMVQSILSLLPNAYARILLQRYKWDANKMLAAYAEDAEKVCKDAGLPSPTEMPAVKHVEDCCGICFDDRELVGLPCGHAFCKDCWNNYLAIEVKEQRQIIECCGTDGKEKCHAVVDEFTVLNLLVDEDLKNQFQKVLTRSFVEDNPACTWCPAPGCENAIMLLERNGESNEAVVCKCGHCFCYRCGLESHRPCSCEMVVKWKKLHGGEDASMDESWVATFSRPCPNCKVPIQKNQGCNHMTCVKCTFHFCWQCMSKFGSGPLGGTDGYSTHKCNGTFEEDANVKDKKAEIERYQHYSARYDAHLNSAKLEKKLLETYEEKISAITKEEGFLCADFSESVHQILQNRTVLKWSYAFGFYRASMAEKVNKNIFENLQLDLERHTELLSNLTNKFVEVATSKMGKSNDLFVQTRQEMIDQKRIAKRVLDALLDASSEWNALNMEFNKVPSTVDIDIRDYQFSDEEVNEHTTVTLENEDIPTELNFTNNRNDDTRNNTRKIDEKKKSKFKKIFSFGSKK